MRIVRHRKGAADFGAILGGAALVLVILLGLYTMKLANDNRDLQAQLNVVDQKGRALENWIGKTDGPEINLEPPGIGLTTWLINLKNHVTEHISKTPNVAHTGAHDMHQDPPRPPGW